MYEKIFKFLIAFSIFFALLSVSSCTKGNYTYNTSSSYVYSSYSSTKSSKTTATKYEVTLKYDGVWSDCSFLVEKGQPIPHLNLDASADTKNYIFCGWYTDSAFTNAYDVSQPVVRNITLYAKYELDALTLTNKISTDTIKSIVKIYNKCYNTFLGFETSSITSQGSGFCFHIQNGYYYVLTNFHVADMVNSYKKQEFIIEDYQGNTYEAYLYMNPNKLMDAMSSSYDLACLYFKPSSSCNIKSLSIAYGDPYTKTDVIALGAPNGQSNSITYGKILNYEKVNVVGLDINFDVIRHSAYTNGGSSGGPLLNPDLKVVGMHFAGNRSTNTGCAIPATKIHEFLKKYVYN